MKDAPEIVAALRDILAPYAPRLQVTADSPTMYMLYTAHVAKNGKPLFFAGMQRWKSYVSYYLMPVYTCPELVKSIGPGLKKRKQGKSCFNFTAPDAALFEELGRLTGAGFARFEKEGWIR